MSLQAINFSPVNIPVNFQTDIDEQLSRAIEQLDIPAIKDLVSRGANPNQMTKVDLREVDKLLIPDDEELIKLLFKNAVLTTEKCSDELGSMCSLILDSVKSGHEFSGEFAKAYMTIQKELAALVLARESIVFGIGDETSCSSCVTTWDMSLFSLALSLRDLGFIEILLDAGIDINVNRTACDTFFEVSYFTARSEEIIELMMSRGYSLDGLLADGESFTSILKKAEEKGDERLISFLRNHGIPSEEVEILPIDIQA